MNGGSILASREKEWKIYLIPTSVLGFMQLFVIIRLLILDWQQMLVNLICMFSVCIIQGRRVTIVFIGPRNCKMYVGMIMMMCWQLCQNQPRLNRHIHISKLMMKFGNQFKIILKPDRFPDKMILFLMPFSIKIQLKKSKNCRDENQLNGGHLARSLRYLQLLASQITPGVIMYGGRVICGVEASGSSSGGFYHFL